MPTFRRRIPSIPTRWSAVPPVLLVILVAGGCAQADPASTAQSGASAEAQAVYQRTPIRAAPAPSTTPAPTTTAPTTTRAPATTRTPATTRPARRVPAPTVAAARAGCDPSYPDACLDRAGDYDCEGGTGNGPNYVDGPLRVRAPDPFDLDKDGDGWGCES
jgi:hypothetical protein